MFHFDSTYARLPEIFYEKISPTPVAAPKLIALADDDLIATLGITRAWLESAEALELLSGNAVADESIALAYAGHQFGGFVPQLGDGRAILLGEIIGTDGKRRDVQLKGSGRTRFSRGGDGRAALGPVLRELIVSEAMHALGVPTTRVLAAVLTGEAVRRETLLPGAILTRIAASHIRIGTFEYFAARRDVEALRVLMNYALERHYPSAPRDAIALFDAVASAQIALVSQWLSLGFVHGVMNTDNTTISGETIDYGPCAFLDTYDPSRVFSSIDRQSRYAFANQSNIIMWNLARFAQTLVPLIGDGGEEAAATLNARFDTLPSRMQAACDTAMSVKLGLIDARGGDMQLTHSLLELMAAVKVDFTLCFRRLSDVAAGRDVAPLTAMFADADSFRAWLTAWQTRCEDGMAERAAAMRKVNPAFIPRNHRVEEVITAATNGDYGPLERLRRVLRRPYEDQPRDADLQLSPGNEQWLYRTFCGT
ncbi:MAG: YdiU family protein [Clostridia bacterium]|nr:YdiU family protein [Deltaproteobacteria bacterium]